MTGLTPPGPSSGRRFSDTEVAQIIERASRLQQDTLPSDSSAGMSLAELEQIAREAGIDPALVRRAASDLDQQRNEEPVSRLAGGPTTLHMERTVEGELVPEAHESIVAEIRRTLGDAGSAAAFGRTLEWTMTTPGIHRRDLHTVRVTIAPRNGRTTISIDEPLHGVLGGLFGGIVGGLGGGVGGAVAGISMGVLQSGSVALGILGTTIGGSYLLARTIFSRVATKRRRRLETLMERLTEQVEFSASAGGRRPALSSERPAPGGSE